MKELEEKNKYTILMVDDLPVNLEILAAAMTNHRILMATNGDKALRIVHGKIRPDLILLDVEMPGLNGYEICRKIRSDTEFDSIPIIFITAKSDRNSIIRGFEVGGQDYVTKPFDPKELVARVNTHLELKRSRERLAELNELLEKKVVERTKDLRTTLEKLELTNNELDTFVYRASHDLRGPTASLLGLVYLGKEFPIGEIPDILDKIELITRNLNKVLDKLTLRHLITQSAIHNKPIDVNQMVNEVLGSLRGPFPEYEVFLQPDFPEFLSDSESLKIIFENLIENALIFGETVGKITIDILVEIVDSSVCITVRDNGPGIEEDVRGKVFDLFYRGSFRSRGNGLGLYLVKKVTEKMHGSVEMNTKVGEYTEFKVLIPYIPLPGTPDNGA